MVSHLDNFCENFGKIRKKFFEIWENFFEIRTTIYKAGLSKFRDLKNLVTKISQNILFLLLIKFSKIKK